MVGVDYNSFVLKKDICERFEDYTSKQMNNYFVYFLDKRIENYDRHERRQLLYFVSKLYELESKYINYIKKAYASNFRYIKNIYYYLASKYRLKYLKTLYEYNYITESHSRQVDSWNTACTIVNLIWRKRIQEAMDLAYPGKYIIGYNFEVINN